MTSPAWQLGGWEIGPAPSDMGLWAQKGIEGLFQLGISPTVTQPGYALTAFCASNSSGDLPIDEAQLGCLNITFDGYPADPPVYLTLQSLTQELNPSSVPITPSNGTFRVFITPDRYAITLDTQSRYFASRILTIAPGGSTNLNFSYRFNTRLTPIYRDRGYLSIWADLFDAQSPKFDFYALEQTDRATNICLALEQAHAWLATNYAGSKHSTTGNRYRVQATSPFGIAWSSGDVIGLDIYSALWFDPAAYRSGTDVLFHEFGHCYSAFPNRLLTWGSPTSEATANLLMISAMRGVMGERAYHWVRRGWNTSFFDAPADAAPDLGFVMDYVDRRFGMQVNRDWFRVVWCGEGTIRGIIDASSFLPTEWERSATVHSFLLNTNLAWLYRWARFDVADATIDRALALLRSQGAQVPRTLAFEPTTAGLRLRCQGQPGATCVLQAADDLRAPLWRNIATNSAADGLFLFKDTVLQAGPSRFYRLLAPGN